MRSWPVELFVATSAATLLAAPACSTESSSRGDRSIESGHASFPRVSDPVGPVDNAYALASKVALPAVKPSESEGLHNVFRLSDHVISGGEPAGEPAFAQLAAMGVKTIVSVDGKTPDAATAAKHGIRYVHIPIEYRGISDGELLELAKTFRECEGPFYAHCFHGKHRGPAAAAVGRLVLDGASREQAIAEMRQWCGTAPEYEGLFRDIATKSLPGEEQTRAFVFDFPAARGFGGFREAMVDVSRRDDALMKLSAKEFAYDPAHPDIDAIHEVGTLADALRIAGTLPEIHDRPHDFQQRLEQAAAQALKLEEQLTAVRRGEAGAADAARKSYAELSKTCTACHAAYRNR